MSDLVTVAIEKAPERDGTPAPPASPPRWYVLPRDKPWDDLVVSLRQEDATHPSIELQARWRGGTERKTVAITFIDGQTTATLPLTELVPSALPVVGGVLRVEASADAGLLASCNVLLISRRHARAAWCVLSLGVIVSLLRWMAAAALFSSKLAATSTVVLGGSTLALLVYKSIVDVFGWFRRADLPLFGVLPPHVAVASVLSASLLALSVEATARGTLVSNTGPSTTEGEVGVVVEANDSVFVWSRPVVPAKSKRDLEGSPGDGFWRWVLHVVTGPEEFRVVCRDIVLAQDRKRILASTGVDGSKVVLALDPGCAPAFTAVVLGKPGVTSPYEPDVASSVNAPWSTAVSENTGRFTVAGFPVTDPQVWVHALPTGTATPEIAWVGARSDRQAPVEVPWRTADAVYESTEGAGGPVSGELSGIQCGESPALWLIPFKGDGLVGAQLFDGETRVMNWQRKAAHRHPAIIVCGVGSSLRLAFKEEPRAFGISIPKALGVKEIRVEGDGQEVGVAECGGEAPYWFGVAHELEPCAKDESPSSGRWSAPASIRSWSSSWLCLPARSDTAWVELVEKGSRLLVRATRTTSGFEFSRLCASEPHRACYFGDQRINPADERILCRFGCNRKITRPDGTPARACVDR